MKRTWSAGGRWPRHPERAGTVVTAGVHRVTRDPMYLGPRLMLVGWSAALGAVASVTSPTAFASYVSGFPIGPEASFA